VSFTDSIRVAIEALIANKMRAALTMLGIVIGVGAVIALMAVGQGSQKTVADRIQGLGSNLIFIRPGSTSTGGVSQGAGTAQTLSWEDALSIPGEIPSVVAVSPEFRIGGQLSARGKNTFTRVIGVTPDYLGVNNMTMADGEFFNDDDLDRRSKKVILGASVAKNLYEDESPVGQTLRLGNGRNVLALQIIGVFSPRGGNSQNSVDDQAFLPLTLAQGQIMVNRGANNTRIVSQITVQMSNKNQVSGAKTTISELLMRRHQVPQPDFIIESQEDIEAAVNEVNKTMTMLLGSIAGISLVVGGIGIMNIMLVSVTERTREIGIRKAVGARRSDIMMQFLTEAVTVTLLGGFIGVGAGVGAAAYLDGKSVAGLGENVQTVISWTPIVAAFAVSAIIGIFFGLYPAQRASRLNPIQALRYE
jgi:putative ABC transport system permease protein